MGEGRSCAVFDDGGLRCWGSGPLGYPTELQSIGDDEHPFEAGDVPTGGAVKQVALGGAFTCILYEQGQVRCIGDNGTGRLGYGHSLVVSPLPSEAEDLSLGEPAKMITAGLTHACALLESGAVRCWGYIPAGALGYRNGQNTVGDDETPGDLPPLDLGGAATAVTAGAYYTCAILGGGTGDVVCWGFNPSGQLGYGHTQTIGDNESPGSEGSVHDEVVEIVSYGLSTCIRLEAGDLTCWGEGSSILGYGNSNTLGDDEAARNALPVMIGGVARRIGGGPKCALMSDDRLRCWGENDSGQIGIGTREDVGDDEVPIESEPAQLGSRVALIARGLSSKHMCALMQDGTVRCWGENGNGELGLGHQENIGDDELPAESPPVRLLE